MWTFENKRMKLPESLGESININPWLQDSTNEQTWYDRDRESSFNVSIRRSDDGSLSVTWFACLFFLYIFLLCCNYWIMLGCLHYLHAKSWKSVKLLFPEINTGSMLFKIKEILLNFFLNVKIFYKYICMLSKYMHIFH